MAKYVAENTVKSLIKANKRVKDAKVAVLGITFKEDCPDTRNTKIIDIIRELQEYEIDVVVTNPVAVSKEVSEKNVFIDVKGIVDKDSIDKERFVYWRL